MGFEIIPEDRRPVGPDGKQHGQISDVVVVVIFIALGVGILLGPVLALYRWFKG